jgi:hypothetical protein
MIKKNSKIKPPNPWLQATWPRLRERKLEMRFEFSCYNRFFELRKAAKRLSHQPLGGLEQERS